ncbi:MAG: CHC2 zinc finger domain-containing protein [Firmicutes bacterium]|nr:CHC2 zinc finger domain-containing protein [Bacillota bacterium]
MLRKTIKPQNHKTVKDKKTILDTKGEQASRLSADNKDFLDSLLQKIDIVGVVERYIPLVRRGGNHWGCCPFHHEKTPSFSVSQSKQMYYCFGCGVGGNIFGFVKAIENIEFWDAVKVLADKAGLPMPEYHSLERGDARNERVKKRERGYDLLKDAALFYCNNLKSQQGKPAQQYLAKRGIEPSIATKFGMGVSLDGYGVIGHLHGKGYQEEEMIFAGIANQSTRDFWQAQGVAVSTDEPGFVSTKSGNNYDNSSGKILDKKMGGSLYDAFYGRLMVPIINHLDKVVGFGGRDLSGNSPAKYKNSAQSEVFDKSNTLFGVNLLKKYKRNGGDLSFVLLVEGYMDTIALHSAGIENVVASMGTALTNKQARQIKQYTETVCVCYDGDSAGQKATLRGLDILSEAGLSTKVVVLKEGLDPDDFIKKYGVAEYKKCIQRARTLEEHKILNIIPQCIFKDGATYDSLSDRDSKDLPPIAFADVEQKSKFCDQALRIIQKHTSVVSQDLYLRFVSHLSGVDENVLKRQLEYTIPTEDDWQESESVRVEIVVIQESAWVYVLASVMHNKAWGDTALIEAICKHFGEMAQSFLNLVKKASGQCGDEFEYNNLGELWGQALVYGFDKPADQEKKYYSNCVRRIVVDLYKQERAKSHNDAQKFQSIDRDIRELEKGIKPEQVINYLREKFEIE